MTVTPPQDFTFDCRRCMQAAVRVPDDAQPIRGSGRGLPSSAEHPLMGYIVRCPHCGTDNVVRPENAPTGGDPEYGRLAGDGELAESTAHATKGKFSLTGAPG